MAWNEQPQPTGEDIDDDPSQTGLTSTAASPELEALVEGELYSGFRAEARYLNDVDLPVGARFVHEHTGFVLDLLQIESVAQAFVWADSLPDSDRGEPHTQEHLLLGKGNVGRFVASLESMTLTNSSAFTQRERTAYHFNTVAGVDVFMGVLEAKLDALLHPDYSDEEIRREVHNYIVSEDADGALTLEEGGTVYNEMVSSYALAGYRIWREFTQVLYGEGHPLALASGGLPEGIREMTPEHIRTFHAGHYQLGNMGMVVAFPSTESVSEVLSEMDAILLRLQPVPTPPDADFMALEDVPPPSSAVDHSVRFVPYPTQEEQDTIDLDFSWAPTRDVSSEDRLLLELFLGAVAGDANTNLYRRLVNSETRELETGATGISAGLIDWPGFPVWLTLSGLPSADADEATVNAVRALILDEFQTIGSWPAGSEALVEFNDRVRSQLVATQRELRNFVSAPTGFGIRGTGARWIEHLIDIGNGAGFDRSLTRRNQQAYVAALLDSGENFWAVRLAEWDVFAEPYALVPQPSPALQAQIAVEREARLRDETERLIAYYGVATAQEALTRFSDEYDATSAELEAIAAQVPIPPFIDTPPMTLDDALQFEPTQFEGEGEGVVIPMVASHFGNLSGGTVGLALSLDAVTENDLVYLALLPSLVRRVGVHKDGASIDYPDMVERLQNELLSLDVYFSVNAQTDRAELAIRGTGTTLEETQAALGWMRQVLYHADWRSENLSRIRDVVDEQLDQLRRTTQQWEEAWVNDPARAYREQDNPIYLSTSSFMTRTHHALRLRWRLMDASDAATLDDVSSALQILGMMGYHEREVLAEVLAYLRSDEPQEDLPAAGIIALSLWIGETSERGEALIREAATDLELTLGDIPDESLAEDWRYLCNLLATELAVPPSQALAELTDLRDRLLRVSGARLFSVGASATLAELNPEIDRLVTDLEVAPTPDPLPIGAHRYIWERLRERAGDVKPVFAGLVNPDTQGGVHLNSVTSTSYRDTDLDSLLTFLTGRMYGGGGAHSIFMKTWGAGLAYSNGVRADAVRGQLRYYAERCPDLPQTLQFVIGELAGVAEDPELAEYALSEAFASRSDRRYEARGEAIANDLADGLLPDQVRTFRRALLDLSAEPTLSQQLFERMADVYGKILPGYGPTSAQVTGAVYFVIGGIDQLESYEAYLQSVEGEGTQVYQLYPRDFWLVGD